MRCSAHLSTAFLLLTPLVLLVHDAAAASNEEVAFPSNDGLMLEGTLRLPDTTSSSSFPGVVLIHGSGPHSRDSVMPGQLNMLFGFSIPVFQQIGDALQNAGTAVLTYDKRSCGTFNSCSNNSYPVPQNNLTVHTFMDDALAAVRYLQSRPEIVKDDITIVGHSQSGQFIPIMLNNAMAPITTNNIAKGVLLAAPFHPIDVLIELQLNATYDLLQELGVNETTASTIVAPLVEMVQGLEDIRNGSNESVSGVSAEFWQSWFDIQEEAVTASAIVDQPMLVLNGDLDWNVPPSEAQAWSNHLEQVGADYATKILACVTHALNCVSSQSSLSDPTTTASMMNPATTPDISIGRNVDPQVTNALIGFVLSSSDNGNTTTTTSAAAGREVVLARGIHPTSAFLLAGVLVVSLA